MKNIFFYNLLILVPNSERLSKVIPAQTKGQNQIFFSRELLCWQFGCFCLGSFLLHLQNKIKDVRGLSNLISLILLDCISNQRDFLAQYVCLSFRLWPLLSFVRCCILCIHVSRRLNYASLRSNCRYEPYTHTWSLVLAAFN